MVEETTRGVFFHRCRSKESDCYLCTAQIKLSVYLSIYIITSGKLPPPPPGRVAEAPEGGRAKKQQTARSRGQRNSCPRGSSAWQRIRASRWAQQFPPKVESPGKERSETQSRVGGYSSWPQRWGGGESERGKKKRDGMCEHATEIIIKRLGGVWVLWVFSVSSLMLQSSIRNKNLLMRVEGSSKVCVRAMRGVVAWGGGKFDGLCGESLAA